MSTLKPDVVCTDLHMPDMDGLALTREIMSSTPTPILVVSGQIKADDQKVVFDLLRAGAVDVVAKPKGGMAQQRSCAQALLNRQVRRQPAAPGSFFDQSNKPHQCVNKQFLIKSSLRNIRIGAHFDTPAFVFLF